MLAKSPLLELAMLPLTVPRVEHSRLFTNAAISTFGAAASVDSKARALRRIDNMKGPDDFEKFPEHWTTLDSTTVSHAPEVGKFAPPLTLDAFLATFAGGAGAPVILD